MWKAMDKLIFFTLFFFFTRSSAKDVIYQLDDKDYYRMPPKNSLDRYEPCVGTPGGMYCTAEADLVADQPSELLTMIQAYSAHDEKHFNYSSIMYGLCLTKSCQQFYNGDTSRAALWNASEACLNHSLSSEYGLQARVTDLSCYHHGITPTPDRLDMAVVVVFLVILALCAAGTLYDFLIRAEGQPGNTFLMAFALRANWARLVAPPSEDPRQVQLRSLNGIRVLTSILVILGHVPVPLVITIENPTWFEWSYRITLFHVLYQGHLITLTFFLLSGFLLAYNMELHAEKRKLTWKILPKAIFIRWLRLTPVSLVMLMLSATWLRHAGIGPFWWKAVGMEWHDCRRYWLYNALYINNLIDHSTCNLQMWSLASDMQLHALGLCAALVVRARRAATLVALYALGVLWTAYHVYDKDLDGTLLATPSTISSFFLTSDAFNYVYKRTYANLPSFVLGMAFGYLFYGLQKRGLVTGDYATKKYQLPYLALLALLPVTVTMAYFLFFGDAPRAALHTRMLFAPTVKPLFSTLVMVIIFGAIYRVNSVVSSILEWRGWMMLARISYCMFAVHVTIVRYLMAFKQTLAYFSLFHLLQEYAGAVVLTILFSMVLHLLVEAPCAALTRALTGPLRGAPEATAAKVNGLASGCIANGHVANGQFANGHVANGHGANGHVANEHIANRHVTNERIPNGLKME